MCCIASIFEKSINGEQLTSDEQKVLGSDSAAVKIINDLTSRKAQWVQTLDDDISANRKIINNLRSAMNLPIEKVAEIARQNPILQSGRNGGIINHNNTDLNGDDSLVDKRTTAASVEEIREQYFKKASDDIRRGVEETAESFAERTRRTGLEGSGGTRLLIRDGSSHIAYTISDKDTPISRFVAKLKSFGIDAYFCEGPIETNANGITSTHYEAFTTVSGKIFFSDSANLPSKEIVDHELVHNLLRQLNNDYFDYEDILIRNLNRESNYYIAFCLELNEREFNNKYDISEGEFSISGASAFNSEVVAYVYQKVLNDRSFADEFFSNMFYDWNEVVNAVYTLNSKMKIDTSELSQATSQNEAASFMPENEAQGGFGGEAETNAADSENASQGEEIEAEEGSFFDEPSADFPEADIIADMGASVAGVERHSDGQRLIIAIARELGYRVVFDKNLKTELGATSNGTIDYDKKIIYLNPKVSKPLQFIFGHELTHFGETSELYDEFIEAIRNSKIYKQWLQRKTQSTSDSIGLLEGLYRDMVEKSRKDAAPVGAAEAQQEMYADFCGETFFADGVKGLNRLLNSLQQKQRPKAIQLILDFVTYLKEKLSGNKQITMQLIRLESRYAQLLKTAKENTAPKSGVKYDFGVTQADIDSYVDAAYKKENTEDYKKYAEASEKLISDVSSEIDISGYSHALRDNDIRHIRNSHGEETNEKYPVTREDMKLIPWIVENYDKVFVVRRDNGKVGIIYVTVSQDGLVYYLEQVTTKYGNEPLLVNKQMIKTGINDIPDLKGLSDAIKQKQSEAEFLADLKKVHEVYAQSVYQPHSIDSILKNEPSVNTKSMQKNKKHSISVDERAEIDAETEAEIGDIPTEMASLMQQYQNGDFDEDTYRERMDELYNAALERFGIIPEGENAVTPIAVPKKISKDKITRRFVRTILERGKLTPDMIADTEQEILLGDMLSYEAVSDEAAMKSADRSFERNTADADWQKAISGGIISKNDIAIGEKLLLKAIEDGDRLHILELSSELADAFTRSGQVVQAARMLKKMSGVGRLMTAQRNVNTINQSLNEKYSHKKEVPQVRLDPEHKGTVLLCYMLEFLPQKID